MTCENAPNPDTVVLPARQLQSVLLARAIEESTAGEPEALARSKAAGTAALHAVGDEAGPGQFIYARACRILADVPAYSDLAAGDMPAHEFFGWGCKILVVAAFLLGITTDRLATTGDVINLLSPPFWGLIAWNVAVYLMLAVKAAGVARLPLGPRSLMTLIARRCASAPFSKGVAARFHALQAKAFAPVMRLQAARALHYAAASFALGLVSSLLVRGLGTYYTVGWESTWLADAPDMVCAFIQAAYGLVPPVAGLPELPGLETVAAMRMDKLAAAAQTASAAPWLARMLVLVTSIIIVPRLLLGFADHCRCKRLEKAMALPITDDYWQGVLVKLHTGRGGRLTIVADAGAGTATLDSARQLSQLWGDAADPWIERMDFSDAQAAVPRFYESGAPVLAAAWFEGAHTPEPDVHGAVIARISERVAVSGGRLWAVVDMRPFIAKTRAYPRRAGERLAAWQELARETGVTLIVIDDADDSLAAAADRMRYGEPAVAARAREDEP
ncbi:MAG: DUF2868 domain-containing protein [Duodenibacillus sp.]|nr:DUF2868 domain-containing protein [Duodenibacillus sp.]